MARIGRGERFPPIALPDAAGAMHALSHAWIAGPALLAFGHGDCSTSRLALPYVDRIHHRRRRGGEVLAVLQEEAQGARDLAVELKLALPVVLDADPYVVGEQLGLDTVPTLVLVDTAGVVEEVVEGFDQGALEALAAQFGAAPLFSPDDEAPSLRPG